MIALYFLLIITKKNKANSCEMYIEKITKI